MTTTKDKDKLFDLRTSDRNIQKGIVSDADRRKFVSNLKDSSKNAEPISMEAIFGDELTRGHRKKSVPAYRSGPKVTYTKSIEEDLEEEFDEDYDYRDEFVEKAIEEEGFSEEKEPEGED